MATNGRPTVRDIARHAGVSVATVTRVTKDDPRVRAETRAKVQASIDALGYRPSALGRSLASGRFDTLGVVLPGLGGPYFADLIQGVEDATVEAGVAVHVLGTHLRPNADDAVRQLAQRTDGLVVVGGTIAPDLLARLATRHPIAVVADDVAGVACVRTDGRRAERRLMDHLLDVHGYRDLRFVGVADGSPDVAQRYAGFRDALVERGLTESAPPLRYGSEVQHGASAAHELASTGDVPQALVCANDELAFGVLVSLPGLGHAIPERCAVVGFDDQRLAALASPSLTTVSQPTRDLGREAARRVLLAVDQPPEARSVRHTVLDTRLRIRESCGCAA